MHHYHIPDLTAQGGAINKAHYLEFLRHASLSAGLYRIPAGAHDPQQPHTEDEVYYVVSGRGHILVGDESEGVSAGSIIFVAAGVEHRFFNVDEELVILVLFAPAEYALRPALEMEHETR